jgi:hypothetical protein
MTGTMPYQHCQILMMCLGHKFNIIHEYDQYKYECNPGARWIYWELPDTKQRRFIQHYAEVDHHTLTPLLEVYCLPAILNHDDQGVMIFCHTRAHCEIMSQHLLSRIRDRLTKSVHMILVNVQ